MGDFNFPRSAIVWKRSEDGFIVPLVASHREEETLGGKQDRLQAQQLVDMASKHFLVQEVVEPTHAIEVLDLVFTNNCELVSEVNVESWPAFSDHKLIVMDTTFQPPQKKTDLKQQFLCDTGRRYAALNFNKAPWQDITADLEIIDWSYMEQLAKDNPVTALCSFHDRVLEVLEKHIPTRKKQSNNRQKRDRMRRLLWKKLAKVRKALKSATSIHKLSVLLQKMWTLESQLSSDYTADSNREEDEAVLRIKQKPKAFFLSFARTRQKTKAKVGPFLDDEGQPNSSADFAADALRRQYDSVFEAPRAAWSVSDFPSHFRVDDDEDDTLQNIIFGPADIEKACSELKSTAAAGPDGVPAVLLKTCRKQLSTPIYHIWRASLDSGCIPPELLLVLICPIHKGGSRSVPKNYRPVALTSHLIKVFERVVRQSLVTHIEKLGLLPDGHHGS